MRSHTRPSSRLSADLPPDFANEMRNQPRKKGKEPQQEQNAFQKAYELLVNAIIRPPRSIYQIADLGPQQFFLQKTFLLQRHDFQVINRRGQRMFCSRWSSTTAQPNNAAILYLHGNSSSRKEVLYSGVLETAASLGYSLIAFDFSGSGLSDGEYVSLGYFEKDDIEDIVQFVVQEGLATKLVLWGRSMGAASALMYTSKESSMVSALVLDSPFASLTEVAQDLVATNAHLIPGFMVAGFLHFLRRSVKKRANFDIRDLEPIIAANECVCPALFLTASDDQMVLPKHGRKLVQKYRGPCQRLEFPGSHNSLRPSPALKSVAVFLQTSLEAPDKIETAFITIRELFGLPTEDFFTPKADQDVDLKPTLGDVLFGKVGAPNLVDFLFGDQSTDQPRSLSDTRRDYPSGGITPQGQVGGESEKDDDEEYDSEDENNFIVQEGQECEQNAINLAALDSKLNASFKVDESTQQREFQKMNSVDEEWLHVEGITIKADDGARNHI